LINVKKEESYVERVDAIIVEFNKLNNKLEIFTADNLFLLYTIKDRRKTYPNQNIEDLMLNTELECICKVIKRF